MKTLSELNRKMAFVKGNRSINGKNLKQKMESIKECGQLMPIIIVDGTAAAEEGLTLVDCKTREVVSPDKVADYVVDIEGQHRLEALMRLQEEDEKNGTSYAPAEIYVMYAQNPKGKSIKKIISELNITPFVWDGKDFITCASLCNPSSELLKFAKYLADLKSTKKGDNLPPSGYPLATVSKLVTFGPSLKKEKLADCMEKGTDCLPTANIGRAVTILDTARSVGFKDQYLAHKYFIDFIIDESNAKSEDQIYGMIGSLKPAQVEAITKITGDNYIAEIRRVVNGTL